MLLSSCCYALVVEILDGSFLVWVQMYMHFRMLTYLGVGISTTNICLLPIQNSKSLAKMRPLNAGASGLIPKKPSNISDTSIGILYLTRQKMDILSTWESTTFD